MKAVKGAQFQAAELEGMDRPGTSLVGFLRTRGTSERAPQRRPVHRPGRRTR